MANLITEWLAARYPEVGAHDFYRDLFPAGELEPLGEYIDGRYCGIAIRVIGRDRAHRYSVTDDLGVIDRLAQTEDFCIMSPVSYAGKTQRQDMARFLYSVTFDLDGIIVKDGQPRGLETLLYQMTDIEDTVWGKTILPLPTYIVSSGTGCHLYYVLERPIPMFKNVIRQLQRLRYALATNIWSPYITTLSKHVQYESVTQGFRMVGTVTKSGQRVRAFRVGGKVSVEYLNGFVPEEYRLTEFSYKSSLTLAQAKKRYPEWYQSRVVEGHPRGTWTCNRALYDWWKRKINPDGHAVRTAATVGHRYFCIMALAIYARKCGIGRDELERDAFGYVGMLDSISPEDGSNDFTEADCMKALEAYDACYQTFPRSSIELLTGISIPANKRNGRTREQNIRRVNAMCDFDVSMGEPERRGRPKGSGTKAAAIRAYAADHPDMSNRAIASALGVSRNTVNKWLK